MHCPELLAKHWEDVFELDVSLCIISSTRVEYSSPPRKFQTVRNRRNGKATLEQASDRNW